MAEELLRNIEKLHTTSMGFDRIRRNLNIDVVDVVAYCREIVLNSDTILERKGKNWYAYNKDSCITINAHSYTIITAHKYVYR